MPIETFPFHCAPVSPRILLKRLSSALAALLVAGGRAGPAPLHGTGPDAVPADPVAQTPQGHNPLNTQLSVYNNSGSNA